jgi:hypothetical protein
MSLVQAPGRFAEKLQGLLASIDTTWWSGPRCSSIPGKPVESARNRPMSASFDLRTPPPGLSFRLHW